MTRVVEQTRTAADSDALTAALVAAEADLAAAQRDLVVVEDRVRRRDPAADEAVLRHAMLRAEGAEQARDRARSAVDERTVAGLLGEAETRWPVLEAEIAEAQRVAKEASADLARRVEARNVWARELLAGLREAGWSPRPAIARSALDSHVGPDDGPLTAVALAGQRSTRELLRDVADAAADAAGVPAERRR